MCIQLSGIDTVYCLVCRYISRAKQALCVTLKSWERGPGDEFAGDIFHFRSSLDTRVWHGTPDYFCSASFSVVSLSVTPWNSVRV